MVRYTVESLVHSSLIGLPTFWCLYTYEDKRWCDSISDRGVKLNYLALSSGGIDIEENKSVGGWGELVGLSMVAQQGLVFRWMGAALSVERMHYFTVPCISVIHFILENSMSTKIRNDPFLVFSTWMYKEGRATQYMGQFKMHTFQKLRPVLNLTATLLLEERDRKGLISKFPTWPENPSAALSFLPTAIQYLRAYHVGPCWWYCSNNFSLSAIISRILHFSTNSVSTFSCKECMVATSSNMRWLHWLMHDAGALTSSARPECISIEAAPARSGINNWSPVSICTG